MPKKKETRWAMWKRAQRAIKASKCSRCGSRKKPLRRHHAPGGQIYVYCTKCHSATEKKRGRAGGRPKGS